jgi:hypothetical protein
MLKWEKLESTLFGIQRCNVPGGWLVVAYESGLTLYADPEHKWDGSSLS